MRAPLLTVATLLALTAGLVPAAATGTPDASPPSAGTAQSQDSWTVPAAPAAARPAARPGRDATMELLDLALARPTLDGTARREADVLLARPGGPRPGPTNGDPQYGSNKVTTDCSDVVCVHHVRRGRHAATPQYAATALATLTEFHTAMVDGGWRAPRSDKGRGGNALPDVYLAELFDQRLYGYCTTDQRIRRGTSKVWSYCVLDDDYAEIAEETGGEPLGLLRATAAHEYAHAVQFGYDVREDPWFMEGTATWFEEQLADEVDDNRSYLSTSQLTRPGTPLDAGRGGFEYGAWIFFQHLTERFPEEQAGLPTLVRDAWRAADAGRTPNLFSTRALGQALAARGTSWRAVYGDFAADGYAARTAYEEGADGEGYPETRPVGALQRGAEDVGVWTPWLAAPLDHLTNFAGRVVPAGDVAPGSTLRVQVDAAPTARGSVAAVDVLRSDGVRDRFPVVLDADGDGEVVVPFDPAAVQRVDVVLANASTRYRCRTGTTLACAGRSRDDDLQHRLRVMVLAP